MRRRAIILAILLTAGTAGSAQYVRQYPPQPQVQSYSTAAVGYALNDWRRLRQSSGYSFGDYARFLNANPGWPGESTVPSGSIGPEPKGRAESLLSPTLPISQFMTPGGF